MTSNLEKALVLNSKLLITYMFYVIMKRYLKRNITLENFVDLCKKKM